MNKRQYKKYCKECLEIMLICGKIVKKHKYFGKKMQKTYKMRKNIRKFDSSRRAIICALPNCEDCGNMHLPF